MLLEHVGRYNDLSEQLRNELTEKVAALGKRARFKFAISNRDPHPDNRGKVIWPSIWTLDPKVFTITDPHETDKKKSRVKQIGLVQTLNDKGEPERFLCIRVTERMVGEYELDLTTEEGKYFCMYALLHPKLKGGQFADKNKTPVFELIDGAKVAAAERTQRSDRKKALDMAEQMNGEDVLRFADAMEWDSTEEVDILRNSMEAYAEASPTAFLKLQEGKVLEYRATVKRGLDRGVISFDPAEWKFLWTADSTPAAMLQMATGKSSVEAMADWLQGGGEPAQKVYKRLKSLLK